VADEHVTGESRESTFQILQSTLAPQLLGENPMNMERIHDVMNKAIYGVPTAKAAIDIACYYLAGKALGVPVYTLLGGRYHTEFPSNHVLSNGKPEDMSAEAMDRVNQGYRSFKMKVATNVLDHV